MNHAEEAIRLITGDRNDSYGTPDQDFSGIAAMWTGLLNTRLTSPITAEDVPLMMCALKLRRQAHKPKDDNLIDARVSPVPSMDADGDSPRRRKPNTETSTQ
jgi:hypothetical protein